MLNIRLTIRIPAPRMPPLWLFSQIVFESIEIAIVSFALNISMAKLFAKRYNYQIRPNQVMKDSNPKINLKID